LFRGDRIIPGARGLTISRDAWGFEMRGLNEQYHPPLSNHLELGFNTKSTLQTSPRAGLIYTNINSYFELCTRPVVQGATRTDSSVLHYNWVCVNLSSRPVRFDNTESYILYNLAFGIDCSFASVYGDLLPIHRSPTHSTPREYRNLVPSTITSNHPRDHNTINLALGTVAI
jgi:hypothetical protein